MARNARTYVCTLIVSAGMMMSGSGDGQHLKLYRNRQREREESGLGGVLKLVCVEGGGGIWNYYRYAKRLILCCLRDSNIGVPCRISCVCMRMCMHMRVFCSVFISVW